MPPGRQVNTSGRCPTCLARKPSEHPAVSGGGEVTRLCPDPYHEPVDPRIREILNAPRQARPA
jgi:hypothetical protein